MIKKIGFVTAGLATGMMMLCGTAAAEGAGAGDYWPVDGADNTQVGLVNLKDVNVLSNLINVDVFAPVSEVLTGLNIPVLSPGDNDAVGSLSVTEIDHDAMGEPRGR